MNELERARWSVIGEQARYAPTLVLDSSYSRQANPQPNRSGGDININKNQSVELGSELRKQTVYGTTLSLRVAGDWQKYEFNQIAGLPPDVTLPELPDTWGFTTKLQLTQPLLRGRGREVGEAELRAARAQRNQAEQARDRVASELLRDVLTAYWELWYADRAVQIEEQSRAVSQRQRDEARARAQTGTLAAADVLTFETQLAQRDEALLTAKGERMRREHELRRLLGLVEKPSALAVIAEEARVPDPLPPEIAEKEALEESRRIRELKAQVELARIQARTAADPLRARLDLDSYIQVRGLSNDDVPKALQMYGGFEAVSAFLSLRYEQPLDGRQYRAAAARARIAVEAAEEQLTQGRNEELSALRIALDQQFLLRDRLALLDQTVQLAEQQLKAEQARFVTGTSTPLQVVQAEDAVRAARLRVARTQADLLSVSLNLEHATGRLLTRYASEFRR